MVTGKLMDAKCEHITRRNKILTPRAHYTKMSSEIHSTLKKQISRNHTQFNNKCNL